MWHSEGDEEGEIETEEGDELGVGGRHPQLTVLQTHVMLRTGPRLIYQLL